MIQKAPLFIQLKERFLFVGLIFLILSINLFFHYKDFQELTKNPIYSSTAVVLKQYIKTKKNGRQYSVLKLRDMKGFIFYTTSYEPLRDLKMHQVDIALLAKDITFLQTLQNFYVPSFNIRVHPREPSLRRTIYNAIAIQHSDANLASLFSALFIATPLEKEMRNSVTLLGTAHLTALSGYHLGLLSTILFFLLKLIYSPLHKRYFPFRNIYYDLGATILFILLGFVFISDSPPSLIRAFVMMFVAFILLYFWLDIFSFETLAIVIGIILALFPNLIFSIGFWLSISGVFYIYLFVQFFKEKKPLWHLFMLNIYLYFALIPIVHTIFPSFALSQLLSIPLSLLFTLFYPIEIFLHLIGFGNLLDSPLKILFDFHSDTKEITTPLWFLILYLVSSLVAMFRKEAFYFTLFLMILFYLFALLS
jgi:competence protein ComEC